MQTSDADRLVRSLAKIPSGEVSAARALKLEPAVLDRLVDRAKALYKKGNVRSGDELLSNLCLVLNRSAALPLLLGALRGERDNHTGAKVAYDEALRRAEIVGDARIAQKSRFGRGQALIYLGAFDEAAADFDAAAAGDNEDVAGLARAWRGQLDTVREARP